MTKEFFEQVMRIPSCSSHEDMMVDFLMEWGPAHGCKTTKDAKGNVYMTKGSAAHPVGCVNHIDTVHRDQAELVEKGEFKEIVWEGDRVTAVNPLTGKQTGLGMDNQGGCAIALAVIERVGAIKAMFPVEEEIGCRGTQSSKYKTFFSDCSFVFSNDSPDRNRATHYSSGTQLYSDGFFERFIEPVFKRHGVSRFNSEPWTDCRWVRLNVKGGDGKNIEVINAGNGGYNPHQDSEYARFLDVCAAEDMMVALCEAVGTDNQYTSDIEDEPRPAWRPYGYGRAAGTIPRRTEQPEFDFGASDEKKQFEWTFTRKANADRYVDKIGRLLEPDVAIRRTGDTAVTVTGPVAKLRTAYRFAFNYDNDKLYMSWSDFVDNVGGAAKQFAAALRPPRRELSDEKCYAAYFEFENYNMVDEFLVRVSSDLPDVDADDDGGVGVSFAGRLGGMKAAYVTAYNIKNGTYFSDWSDFENSDAKAAKAALDDMVEDGDGDEKETDGRDVISEFAFGDWRTADAVRNAASRYGLSATSDASDRKRVIVSGGERAFRQFWVKVYNHTHGTKFRDWDDFVQLGDVSKYQDSVKDAGDTVDADDEFESWIGS